MGETPSILFEPGELSPVVLMVLHLGVRNSSLVKWFCADNVAGLKRTAEAVATTRDAGARNWSAGVLLGRGASCMR